MRPLALAALLTAVTLPGFALPAAAEAQCGSRADLVRILEDQYGERPVFLGTHRTEDRSLQVYLNPTTRTWTVFAFQGDTACILASGDKGALAGQPS